MVECLLICRFNLIYYRAALNSCLFIDLNSCISGCRMQAYWLNVTASPWSRSCYKYVHIVYSMASNERNQEMFLNVTRWNGKWVFNFWLESILILGMEGWRMKIWRDLFYFPRQCHQSLRTVAGIKEMCGMPKGIIN